MRVTVKLFATLTRYREGLQAGRPFEMNLSAGACLQDLLRELKIPPEESRVMFVNGLIHEPDWSLKEGDQVGIFPPVGGG